MTSSSTPSSPPAREPDPGSAPATASASPPGADRPPMRRLVARGRGEAHRVASPLDEHGQQAVLPLAALAVVLCTFLGHWAVLAAGVVAAGTVATGVAFTARTAGAEGARTAAPGQG